MIPLRSASAPLWVSLAYLDLMARFRRSWVGGVWLVITPTIFVGAVSVVYGTLFQVRLVDYIPTLALGYVCWGYLAGCAAEGPLAVVESGELARNVPNTPIWTWMARVVARQIISAAAPFGVALAATAACGKLDLRLVPLGVLGVALLLAIGGTGVVILAIIGTRYRDVQPIVGNAMGILFLITPVMWSASMLNPSRRWVIELNPLASVIAVARDPWLGIVPSGVAYIEVALVLVVLSAIARGIYERFQHRIVYWL